MRTAEARIPTDHAAGYLVQLCRHLEGIGAAGHETSRHGDRSESTAPLVEYSGHQGVIDFGWARCTLDVGDRELTLRAAADNPDDLQRLQDVIAGRVEEIGRRDHLAVTWTQTTSTSSGDEPRSSHRQAGPTRSPCTPPRTGSARSRSSPTAGISSPATPRSTRYSASRASGSPSRQGNGSRRPSTVNRVRYA